MSIAGLGGPATERMPILAFSLSHRRTLSWHVHVRRLLVYMVRGLHQADNRLGFGGQLGLLLLLRQVRGRFEH